MSSEQQPQSNTKETFQQEIRQFVAEAVFFFEKIGERAGLHATDLQCLNLLSSLGPMTAGTLAKRTGLTTGAVTRVIDRLEKAGYVQRERSERDRRTVLIRPQPKMAELDAFFERYLQQAWSELYESYGPHELAIILDFLRKTHPLNQQALAQLHRDTASFPS
uniref:Putative HTH-type transcriptional regulator YcgE n=1 Tax=Thermosporothrix sp. COM3 TaxID=2490863 RepID=A0A455SL18_9CHLR|nr:putative HTH-type transcriptional regulator YcgE [Thermosporothrix sp. COM3]